MFGWYADNASMLLYVGMFDFLQRLRHCSNQLRLTRLQEESRHRAIDMLGTQTKAVLSRPEHKLVVGSNGGKHQKIGRWWERGWRLFDGLVIN